jgi:hypothetical protein
VQERLANLRMVFLGGPRHPDGPFEPVDATEVVAGAALVALALPGGQRLALDTLRAVTADGWWFARWLSEVDREESRHAVETVAGVLGDHLASTSGR